MELPELPAFPSVAEMEPQLPLSEEELLLALGESVVIPEEVSAEFRTRLRSQFDRFITRTDDPMQKAALNHLYDAIDWVRFGLPGERLPDSLVITESSRDGMSDIRLNSHIPYVTNENLNVLLSHPELDLEYVPNEGDFQFDAGWSWKDDLSPGPLDDLSSNKLLHAAYLSHGQVVLDDGLHDGFHPVYEAARQLIDESPIGRFIDSFDGGYPTDAQTRPLNRSEYLLRAAAVEHGLRAEFGLHDIDLADTTPTEAEQYYTDSYVFGRRLSNELFRIDNERVEVPAPAGHSGIDALRSYIYGKVTDYVHNIYGEGTPMRSVAHIEEDNVHSEEFYPNKPPTLHFSDGTKERWCDGYTAVATAIVHDICGNEDPYGLHETYVAYVEMLIVGITSKNQPNTIADAKSGALDAAAERLHDRAYDALGSVRKVVERSYEGSKNTRRYSSKKASILLGMRQPTGKHMVSSEIWNANLAQTERRRTIDIRPKEETQQNILDVEGEVQDRNTKIGRVAKYDSAGATAVLRLLNFRPDEGQQLPSFEPENADLIIDIEPNMTGTHLPYVYGYTLVGFNEHSYGFIRDPNGDPYVERPIIISTEQKYALFDQYEQLGMYDLARDIDSTKELTVTGLRDIIYKHTRYTRFSSKNPPDNPPIDVELLGKANSVERLEDFKQFIKDGKLLAQCSGSASFLSLSLQTIFGKRSSEVVGGFTISGTDDRIDGVGHAQVLLITDQGVMIIDANNTARPTEILNAQQRQTVGQAIHDMLARLRMRRKLTEHDTPVVPQLLSVRQTEQLFTDGEVTEFADIDKPAETKEQIARWLETRLFATLGVHKNNRQQLYTILAGMHSKDPLRQTYELAIQPNSDPEAAHKKLNELRTFIEIVQNADDSQVEEARRGPYGIDMRHHSSDQLLMLLETVDRLKSAL